MARKKKTEEVVENVVESNEVAKEETTTIEKKTYKVVDCTALRIRKEANLNSEVLGTVAAGEVVEVLAEDEEWVQVANGYMLKKFLK
jgi:uncharacterized protein YgiM (DUF1202 family)